MGQKLRINSFVLRTKPKKHTVGSKEWNIKEHFFFKSNWHAQHWVRTRPVLIKYGSEQGRPIAAARAETPLSTAFSADLPALLPPGRASPPPRFGRGVGRGLDGARTRRQRPCLADPCEASVTWAARPLRSPSSRLGCEWSSAGYVGR